MSGGFYLVLESTFGRLGISLNLVLGGVKLNAAVKSRCSWSLCKSGKGACKTDLSWMVFGMVHSCFATSETSSLKMQRQPPGCLFATCFASAVLADFPGNNQIVAMVNVVLHGGNPVCLKATDSRGQYDLQYCCFAESTITT